MKNIVIILILVCLNIFIGINFMSELNSFISNKSSFEKLNDNYNEALYLSKKYPMIEREYMEIKNEKQYLDYRIPAVEELTIYLDKIEKYAEKSSIKIKDIKSRVIQKDDKKIQVIENKLIGQSSYKNIFELLKVLENNIQLTSITNLNIENKGKNSSTPILNFEIVFNTYFNKIGSRRF